MDSRVKGVKSHVQANKGILKRFAFKEDGQYFVYIFCMKTKEIRKENIKSLGVIDDYFDTEAEVLLDREVEGPFGQVISTIRHATVSGKFSLNLKEIEDVYKYMIFCHLRSKRLTSESEEMKAVFDIFKDRMNSVNLQSSYMKTAILNDEYKRHPFYNFEIFHVRNMTDLNLLLPYHCVYIVPTGKGRDMIVLPIDPKNAFMLVEGFEKTGKIEIMDIDDLKMIESFNVRAFATELLNNECLIASSFEELILFQKTLLNK